MNGVKFWLNGSHGYFVMRMLTWRTLYRRGGKKEKALMRYSFVGIVDVLEGGII
jgi:hypothetical protein